MKTLFTKDEAAYMIQFAKEEFDFIRIVEPIQRLVYTNNQTMTAEICHSLWGRCDRCENCSSMRALSQQKTVHKIEFIKENVFLIVSKYMNIEDNPFVLEMVSDITSDFMINNDQKDKLAKIIENHNRLIIIDSLTGLYNRRFLDQHFIPSLQCCYEEKITVNIAVLDIDDFKQVNDQFGHLAGDKLLQDIAQFWKLHFNTRRKNYDQLTIRYGGDEMIIVSCGNNLNSFKEKISSYYDGMRKICYFGKNDQIPFSLSLGISSTEEFASSPAVTWPELFSLADKRLYENKSKKKGHN